MNGLTAGLFRTYVGCSLVSGNNEIRIYSVHSGVFVQNYKHSYCQMRLKKIIKCTPKVIMYAQR